MAIQRPFNIHKWINENRDLLKPPVSNKEIYVDAEDFIVMIVGGPNARKDYHYNETEEFFYQIEGDVEVTIQENGKAVKVPIKEGEFFLLPKGVPHSPARGANTVGLVVEFKRKEGSRDGLLWFCDKCNNKLHATYFTLKDIEKDFQPRFKEFYTSKDLRTCKNCGHEMEIDERFI